MIGAWSPAEPPRLTSRPSGRRARAAAAAGIAVQRVDDEVERPVAGVADLGGEGLGIVGRLDLDERVGVEPAGALARPRRPGRRQDPACSEGPRQLDGHLSDDAACAEDEDLLAGLEPAPPRQRHPGRDPGQAQRSHLDVVAPSRAAGRRRAPARWRLRAGCRRRGPCRPRSRTRPGRRRGRSRCRARRPRPPGRPGRTAWPGPRSTTCPTRTAGRAAPTGRP